MKCFFFVEAMLLVLESLVDMADWFLCFCVKQERLECCSHERKWKYRRAR